MKKYILLVISALLLTACGGGGGGGSAPTDYAVTVNVSGLTLADTVVLQNNGADDISVTTNGTFEFTTKIANGSSYNVSIKPQPTNVGHWCGAVNGIGISSVNVTVDVHCIVINGSWGSASDFTDSRRKHTSTLLNSGEVLIIGGASVSGVNAVIRKSAEIYNTVSAGWTNAVDLSFARYAHTATKLQDGSVLVVGGNSGGNALKSVELYEFVPGTGWIPTQVGDLTDARYNHAATLLNDGRVLVTGGATGTGSTRLTSAELYDPGTQTWSSAGSMTTARELHTATLLEDGSVLIAGGIDGTLNSTGSVENYVPGAWSTGVVPIPLGTWNPGPVGIPASLAIARDSHTATLLPDGKVIIVGGKTTDSDPLVPLAPLASTAIFDPIKNEWSNPGSLTDARYGHIAIWRPDDGTILVTGGGGIGVQASTELYDSITGKWVATSVFGAGTGDLISPRFDFSGSLLSNGKILVTGGVFSETVGGVKSTTILKTAELY